MSIACGERGKCTCKVNYAGHKCNECADGFYKTNSSGYEDCIGKNL